MRPLIREFRVGGSIAVSLKQVRALTMNDEKEYSTPSVTVYGSVEKITREAGEINADSPNGPNDTAYSPGPE